ncbi:centromere protein F [Nematostella vectensis]|uniref:centromere protein F n=1 Tax=Nematostella vectensis TaxID=45351 RepID=UPI002077347E|nr:centromere protein F [Nematostella vectensis]
MPRDELEKRKNESVPKSEGNEEDGNQSNGNAGRRVTGEEYDTLDEVENIETDPEEFLEAPNGYNHKEKGRIKERCNGYKGRVKKGTDKTKIENHGNVDTIGVDLAKGPIVTDVSVPCDMPKPREEGTLEHASAFLGQIQKHSHLKERDAENQTCKHLPITGFLDVSNQQYNLVETVDIDKAPALEGVEDEEKEERDGNCCWMCKEDKKVAEAITRSEEHAYNDEKKGYFNVIAKAPAKAHFLDYEPKTPKILLEKDCLDDAKVSNCLPLGSSSTALEHGSDSFLDDLNKKSNERNEQLGHVPMTPDKHKQNSMIENDCFSDKTFKDRHYSSGDEKDDNIFWDSGAKKANFVNDHFSRLHLLDTKSEKLEGSPVEDKINSEDDNALWNNRITRIPEENPQNSGDIGKSPPDEEQLNVADVAEETSDESKRFSKSDAEYDPQGNLKHSTENKLTLYYKSDRISSPCHVTVSEIEEPGAPTSEVMLSPNNSPFLTRGNLKEKDYAIRDTGDVSVTSQLGGSTNNDYIRGCCVEHVPREETSSTNDLASSSCENPLCNNEREISLPKDPEIKSGSSCEQEDCINRLPCWETHSGAAANRISGLEKAINVSGEQQDPVSSTSHVSISNFHDSCSEDSSESDNSSMTRHADIEKSISSCAEIGKRKKSRSPKQSASPRAKRQDYSTSSEESEPPCYLFYKERDSSKILIDHLNDFGGTEIEKTTPIVAKSNIDKRQQKVTTYKLEIKVQSPDCDVYRNSEEVKGILTATKEGDGDRQSSSRSTQPETKRGRRNKDARKETRSDKSGKKGGDAGDDPSDPDEEKDESEEDQERKRHNKKAALDRLLLVSEKILNEELRHAVSAVTLHIQESKDGKRNVFEGSWKEEASQTDDEGSIDQLQKIVRSRDHEIKLLKKLLEDCRCDYEELQRSFDRYSSEFREVDKNRELIASLTRQLDAKNRDIKDLKETVVKFKRRISQIQVDIDILMNEKTELAKQIDKQVSLSLSESSDKQHSMNEKEKYVMPPLLRKSSSTGDACILKAEEQNQQLLANISIMETNLKKAKSEGKKCAFKLSKLIKADKQKQDCIKELEGKVKALESNCETIPITIVLGELRAIQAEISKAISEVTENDNKENVSIMNELKKNVEEPERFHNQRGIDHETDFRKMVRAVFAIIEDLKERIKSVKENTSISTEVLFNKEMEKKIEELEGMREEYDSLLMDEKAKAEALEFMITASNKENEKLRALDEGLEKDVSRLQGELKRTTSFKDRELNNLKRDLEKKDNRLEQLTMESEEMHRSASSLKAIVDKLKERLAESEDRVDACSSYIEDLEKEIKRLQKQIKKGKMRHQQTKELDPLSLDKVKNLRDGLDEKITCLSDVLKSFDVYSTKTEEIRLHPCSPMLDRGMKILCDSSGLLNAISEQINKTNVHYSESDRIEHDSQLDLVADLEAQVKALKQQNDLLKAEKETLFESFKSGQDELSAGDLKARLGMCTKELKKVQDSSNEIHKENQGLREELKMAKRHIESLKSTLIQVEQQAAVQEGDAILELKACYEHIRGLQQNLNKMGTVEKNLKEHSSASEHRNIALEAERTGSQERLNDLISQNDKLNLALKALENEKNEIEQELQALKNNSDKKKIDGEEESLDRFSESISKLRQAEHDLEEKLEVFQGLLDNVKSEIRQSNKEVDTSSDCTPEKDEYHERTESELELKGKVKVLLEKVEQLEFEKADRDQKIQTLLESVAINEELRHCLTEKDNAEQKLKKTIQQANSEHILHTANLMESESFERKMNELDERIKERNAVAEELSAHKAELLTKLNKLEGANKELQDQLLTSKGYSKEENKKSKDVLQMLHSSEEAKLRTAISDMEAVIHQVNEERKQAKKEMEAMKETRITRTIPESITSDYEKHCAKENQLRRQIQALNTRITGLSRKEENKTEDDSSQEKQALTKESLLEEITHVTKNPEFFEKEKILQDQITSLKSQIACIVSEKKKLETENQNIYLEREMLSKGSKEKIEELSTQLEHVLGREETLRVEIKTLNSQITQLTEEKATSSIDFQQQLQEKIINSIDTHGALQEQAKALTKEVCKLVEENTKLKSENSQLKLENENIKVLRGLVDDLKKEVARLKSLEADSTLLEAEINQLRLQSTAASDEHTAKIDHLLKNVTEHMERERSLYEQVSSLKRQLRDSKSDLIKYEQEISNQTRLQTDTYRKQAEELMRVTKLADSFMSSEKALKADLDLMNVKVNTLETEKTLLENEMEKTQAKNKKSLKSKERKIRELGEDLARQSAREKDLVSQVMTLKKIVNKCTEEKNTTWKDCQGLRCQIALMSRQSMQTIKELQSELRRFEELCKERQHQLRESSSKIEKLTEEKLTAENKAQGLQVELKTNLQRHEEKAQSLNEMIKKEIDKRQELVNEMQVVKKKLNDSERLLQEKDAENKRKEMDAALEAERTRGTIEELSLQLKNSIQIEEDMKRQIEEMEGRLAQLTIDKEKGAKEREGLMKMYNNCQKRLVMIEDAMKEKDVKMLGYRQALDQLHGQLLDAREERQRAEQILESRYSTMLQEREARVQLLEYQAIDTNRTVHEYKKRLESLALKQRFDEEKARDKDIEANLAHEVNNQRRAANMLYDSLDQSEQRVHNLFNSQQYLLKLRATESDLERVCSCTPHALGRERPNTGLGDDVMDRVKYPYVLDSLSWPRAPLRNCYLNNELDSGLSKYHRPP